jgi:hydrogenase nickel incorporation protein HypA/HybF
MHEMSIIQNILDDVEQSLSKAEYSKVINIKIKVGEFIALDPSSLQFCYKALTNGTKFENTELLIEIIPLTGICNNCKQQININNFLFVCGECASDNIEIISGQELILSEINVD